MSFFSGSGNLACGQALTLLGALAELGLASSCRYLSPAVLHAFCIVMVCSRTSWVATAPPGTVAAVYCIQNHGSVVASRIKGAWGQFVYCDFVTTLPNVESKVSAAGGVRGGGSPPQGVLAENPKNIRGGPGTSIFPEANRLTKTVEMSVEQQKQTD